MLRAGSSASGDDVNEAYAIIVIVIALLIGAVVAFGRGPNRCAVKPRREP